MREIINIQIGKGGNQIGLDFWEALHIEHSLDPYGDLNHSSDYQKEKFNVYFLETIKGSYCARSIQVDSDPDFINEIQQSYIQNLFSQSSFIYGNSSSNNNFSQGYSQLELLDQVQEEIRLQAEQSECLQGFQLMRSLGGGTGSGYGSLILQMLNDLYPKNMISNFSIFPTPGVNDIIVEPYNAVLSIPGLYSQSNFCFSFHNGTLNKILMKIIGNNTPSLKDLNTIIKQSISGVTALWRFPSQISNDIRKFAMNLVPFPNLNYINISLHLCITKITNHKMK
ncbi:tubulin/FtsZ family, GTPase domain protein (macronuclear) [Tetrahymena thermophila SB210]|uniref:Tubulin beta chain n=1 Tax=Tetrahymena thermophila (strain SB210) TaxID=312017 RepID=Q24D61_TETTS|nr:tubulin/FtsZ family, GTPase domain protein [Tetrahymena thermophila SB210]EAS05728.2 tubulin/FtsZ family, GTPase domain protein [Tetrahymena thermophila SB210]|eukprot:XP_001025973.2 tubulin/FtsZ family, GTPase domain protein [Tetrahymena thermophila SB210]